MSLGSKEGKGEKGLPLAYESLDRLLDSLEDFQIHLFTDEADNLYHGWTGKGSGPGQNDWRIAASAVSAGWILVTADKHFARIQQVIPALTYEDWGLVV